MIEHELLFLGLLMESPKHGYDIKRQIEDELMPLIGLEIKSIYYPLQKMEKSGFIKKDSDKKGNWPEKYVYSITHAGRKKFDELITKSFLYVERPYFQIDLSLYFLSFIDKNIAKKHLKTRIAVLKKIRAHLVQLLGKFNNQSRHVLTIIQHDLDLCEAEILSIQRLTGTI